MEHTFWYIVLIIIIAMVLIALYGVYTEKRAEHQRALEITERERKKLEAQNWRKVGVLESYRNRNMLEIRFRDVCPVCGKEDMRRAGESGMMPISCPTCEKRFERDMKDGVCPSGLSESARKRLNFDSYYSLRLIEYELRSGAISESEAHAKHQALIDQLNQMAQPRPQPPKKDETSYRNDYLF